MKGSVNHSISYGREVMGTTVASSVQAERAVEWRTARSWEMMGTVPSPLRYEALKMVCKFRIVTAKSSVLQMNVSTPRALQHCNNIISLEWQLMTPNFRSKRQ